MVRKCLMLLGERLQPKLLLTVFKKLEFQKKSNLKPSLSSLQEQLDKLAVYNPKFFPEGTTTNDIISVDDLLTSTEPLMTDDGISCDVLDEGGSETKDDTDDVSNKPTFP